jgi:alpha-tubulin suppressor-like RCC1 family protein
VVFLAARDYHTMIIKSDGSIWGWGSDENGELGDNDIQDKSAPVLSLFPVAFQNHLFLPLMKFMP